MASKTSYQHCNHCEKLLSKKVQLEYHIVIINFIIVAYNLLQSYDEHRKLYYDELTSTWVKNCQKFDDAASGSSSVPVSLPCAQADHDNSSSGSSSEMICGDDGVVVNDHSNIDQVLDEKCK